MQTQALAENLPRDHQSWQVVAERLARDVQAGLLPPGTWLKQIDLETRYGHGRSDIRRALDETNGNITEAARKLGISRRTLHRKLKPPASSALDVS